MKKRTHWFVAAGLALCGLLLAALTLGQPRDVPESSRDNEAQPWKSTSIKEEAHEICLLMMGDFGPGDRADIGA